MKHSLAARILATILYVIAWPFVSLYILPYGLYIVWHKKRATQAGSVKSPDAATGAESPEVVADQDGAQFFYPHVSIFKRHGKRCDN